MDKRDLIRVAENDPERCSGSIPTGQCRFKGIYDGRCPLHTQKGPMERAKVRQYQLEQWQRRMSEFAENEEVKSLREEIGITRMTLETVVKRCVSDVDLILNANKISDLVMKIEKLVTSCAKLEESSGQTLDKSTVLNIATIIINIVSEHVEDPIIIEAITNKIESSLNQNED